MANTTSQSLNLLNPSALARIKDLPLLAKCLAQGFLQGVQHSIQKGTGVEFSQYRSYEPGDALSKIDWKLYARSDKYFVREAQRESNINVWLVIDSSNSMLQQSVHSQPDDPRSWHKLDYARTLLATLSYLAQQQGDAIGLLNLSQDNPQFLPAHNGAQHWRKVLLALARIKAGGTFPAAQTLLKPLARLQDNALVIVVSDFYQHNQDILAFMRKLNSSKTEVMAIQLESDDEVLFPYEGLIRFEDLESHQSRLLWAKDAKRDYLAARAEFNHVLASQLNQAQIGHTIANIDKPLDATLHQILSLRRRLR